MSPSKSWDPRDLAVDPAAPVDPFGEPVPPPVEPRPGAQPPRPATTPPRRPSALANLARPFGIVVLAAAIAGGILLYKGMRASPLQILNGFDFPVQVSLREGEDETVHTVPARGRVEQTLAGQVAVRVTRPSGELLSEETVEVPRGHDLVAYNVLGAAAVFAEEVVYTTGSAIGRQPVLEHFAGQTFIARERVEYVFEPPDEEIELSTSDDEASRWHFDYIGDGGWSAAVNVLMGQGAREPAQRVIDAVLQADPENAMALSYRSYIAPPAPPVLTPGGGGGPGPGLLAPPPGRMGPGPVQPPGHPK